MTHYLLRRAKTGTRSHSHGHSGLRLSSRICPLRELRELRQIRRMIPCTAFKTLLHKAKG